MLGQVWTALSSVTSLDEAVQFGICGLLFVMWWYERRDRLEKERREHDAQQDKDRLYNALATSTTMNANLIGIIERCTAASEHAAEATDRLTDQVVRLRECAPLSCPHGTKHLGE